ncbi:serine hydrolase [Microbacterium sp. SS28]|uniref:serine hydrolase domain-containing protein n=1 Tax=Microbacterium sp. SS28 TaxID=2919948 RepID=UPI001FAAF595|nr:serine hydrolase domain-containing protein [Microbacterium sp. SS28]
MITVRLSTYARYGFALLLSMAAIALPTVPASAAQDEAIDVEAVDQFVIDSLAQAGIPGAAIAITRGREIVHVRGYGHDSEGSAVTDGTSFRIASLSKAFTSLAVMQLVDAGKIALDDSVYSRLPEFHIADPRGKDITIRELLDQTSGLADREVPDLSRPQPATLAEAAASLHAARLVADPGDEFNYHNPNYQVAARLVEVVSGESFDEYLRHHVFRPAGMDASTDTKKDNDPVADLAGGHLLAYGRPVPVPAPGDFADGAGGVVSTAADMAQWLIVQAGGGVTADGVRIVSESAMTQMHTSRGSSRYALGWSTSGPEDAPTRLTHTGNLLTFSAATAILPESRIGLSLMFNASSGVLIEQIGIFHGVLDIIEGGDPRPTAPYLSRQVPRHRARGPHCRHASRGVSWSGLRGSVGSPPRPDTCPRNRAPRTARWTARAGRVCAQARWMVPRWPRLHLGHDPVQLARARDLRCHDCARRDCDAGRQELAAWSDRTAGSSEVRGCSQRAGGSGAESVATRAGDADTRATVGLS